MILSFFLLALTFAFGWSTVTYREQAQGRGWPVGALFWSKDGAIKSWGGAALLLLIILGVMHGPWWFLLAVPLGGIVLSFFVLQVFRSWTQLFGALGFLVGFVSTSLLVH